MVDTFGVGSKLGHEEDISSEWKDKFDVQAIEMSQLKERNKELEQLVSDLQNKFDMKLTAEDRVALLKGVEESASLRVLRNRLGDSEDVISGQKVRIGALLHKVQEKNSTIERFKTEEEHNERFQRIKDLGEIDLESDK